MAIADYNTDPDLNVDISGINIAEGCPPSGINNAIRQMMADVKSFTDAPTFSGGMTVSSGATISGGAAISGGATISGGISADTLTVTSGATISGGATVTSGVTADTLTVTSGATISGQTTLGGHIAKNVSTGMLIIVGGTSGNDEHQGAKIGLYGGDSSNPGEWFIQARKVISGSIVNASLNGNADGTLTWNGGTLATINTKTGCTRYSNGYQICCGSCTASNGQQVNFTSAFKSAPQVVIQRAANVTPQANNAYTPMATNITSTGFKAYGHKITSNAVAFDSVSANYIAIGTWK